jgi:cytoskeletal protein CcmA (bactofilin family)
VFHRKNDKLKMVLGEGARINGDIDCPGAVFVDGAVCGNVAGAKVIVGEHGRIEGNIKAGAIIAGGMIKGNLDGTERVEIKATGRVTGDIATRILVIAAGGFFSGTSRMEGADANTDDRDGSKILEFLVKEK